MPCIFRLNISNRVGSVSMTNCIETPTINNESTGKATPSSTQRQRHKRQRTEVESDGDNDHIHSNNANGH